MRKFYVQYYEKGEWINSYPIWHIFPFYFTYEGAESHKDFFKIMHRRFYPNQRVPKVRILEKYRKGQLNAKESK